MIDCPSARPIRSATRRPTASPELPAPSGGPDLVDLYRRAASYVDRILRGAKKDLPVQFPTKFEMVVNLKTAKGLGLAMPPSIRLRADEVIE
jgi:putative ABC transport system substrate-binding protein